MPALLFPIRRLFGIVEEARRLGLNVTGMLGVLDLAAERGLIDLPSAVTAVRQTNFRIDPSLLDRLLDADRLRRGIG
jgi:predicted nucleic acid-binding protein